MSVIDILGAIFLLLLFGFTLWVTSPPRIVKVDEFMRPYLDRITMIPKTIRKATRYTHQGQLRATAIRMTITRKNIQINNSEVLIFLLRAIISPYLIVKRIIGGLRRGVNHDRREPK